MRNYKYVLFVSYLTALFILLICTYQINKAELITNGVVKESSSDTTSMALIEAINEKTTPATIESISKFKFSLTYKELRNCYRLLKRKNLEFPELDLSKISDVIVGNVATTDWLTVIILVTFLLLLVIAPITFWVLDI